MSTPSTVAVAYARQSHGNAASIDQQGETAERIAVEQGWSLVAVYSDGSSASRFATKAREDWARVLDGIERREFGVLILWESSRGDRRASSWLAMLETARDAGVRIYVTSHERLYDLSIASDWKVLATEGVDSEHESAKTSARVRRDKLAKAEAGEPTGRTPLGYVRLYDPITRKRLAQVPDDHPDAIVEVARIAAARGEAAPRPSAPMIREMFERLASGQAMRSIARDFAEAGWRTQKGTPFTMAHLRTLAAMHAYAGLRAHLPNNTKKVTASGLRNQPAGRVTIYDGTWDGLVTREQFEQVQAMYADRAREKFRPSRAERLLTVIAVCDVCGGPMTVRRMPGKKPEAERPMSYTCRHKGCTSIVEADLDAFASDVIVEYLERADVVADMARLGAATGEDVQALRDQIAALTARLDALADNLDLSESILAKRSAALERELDALRKREREAVVPPALDGLIAPGKGVAARWAASPLEVQRAVARIVLVPGLQGRLRVKRKPTQGIPAEVHERVGWDRPGDPKASPRITA